ncbi:MAG TPA: LysE family translocator [Caulobacteraceae bacterium]|jgi:threonine/homoserine/homoserine lactone efflux protein
MNWPVDPARYLAFLGAMAILAATPGPSNLFAVANGMSRGRRAVLLGVAGMNTATLIWYVAAALGLGALALAFPQAVKLLIVLGAAYLVWLAWKAVKAGFAREGGLGHVTIHSGRSAFWDSFLVQITNPKILLFFGAILPPFLDFERPLVAQFLLFAAATVALDATATTAYGLGGAALSRRMAEPGFRRVFGVAVAAVLLAAAGLIVSRLS